MLVAALVVWSAWGAQADAPSGSPLVIDREHSFGERWVRTHPFTIMTWLRQSGFDTTQYRDAGFTALLTANPSQARQAFANDWTLHFNLWAEELTPAIVDKVEAFSDPADDNAWFIWDEPGSRQLPGVGAVARWLRQHRPNALVYLNVANTTDAFLDSLMSVVEPHVLMYDFYPFYTGNRSVVHGPANMREFISTLMVVASTARRHGVPFFSWMQAFTSVDEDWRAASASELRMQVFVSLTAGVKGLAYFCYEPWTPGSNFVFEEAMLTQDLKPDAGYRAARSINVEVLNLAPALLQLESTDVRFVPGRTDGTPHTPYQPLANWDAGAGAIAEITGVAVDGGQSGALRDGLIGFFRDDADNRLFMLTNLYCDPARTPSETTLSFTITFDASVTKVYRLSRQTGAVVEMKLDADNGLRVTLPGGTGNLYSLSRGSVEGFLNSRAGQGENY